MFSERRSGQLTRSRRAQGHIRQRKRWFEEQAAKNEAFAKLPKASAWAKER